MNYENIHLSLFENSAFKYSELFNFGSNILYRDVAKVCKLSLNNSQNLIKDTNFNDINLKKGSNVEERYFDHNNLKKRQISLQHVEDIINARISEICDILLKKILILVLLITMFLQNCLLKTYIFTKTFQKILKYI